MAATKVRSRRRCSERATPGPPPPITRGHDLSGMQRRGCASRQMTSTTSVSERAHGEVWTIRRSLDRFVPEKAAIQRPVYPQLPSLKGLLRQPLESNSTYPTNLRNSIGDYNRPAGHALPTSELLLR